MVKGSNVRFVADSRQGDWSKGDVGEVTRIIALPPENQIDLYLVSIQDTEVWATGKDIERYEQLALF